MTMRTMDLNADLGEGGSHDKMLIALASSANISCGGHAGDESTIRKAIEASMAAGVAIGAHPGYEDPLHFGRRPLQLDPSVVTELIARQIESFAAWTELAGAEIHHVKPHGALYSQADGSLPLAAAVAEGVRRVLPGCGFYVPPSGKLAEAGHEAGLAVWGEGFVDRRYLDAASLVPRGESGAVIEDIDEAVAQALEIACNQQVRTMAGTLQALTVSTLCVHGDGKIAVAMLRSVRIALEAAGFSIQSRMVHG
jgi:UPF0271 protein